MEPIRSRLPGHRRTPQPRPAGLPRRHRQRGRRLRQHRADRARRLGQPCVHEPSSARRHTCPRTGESSRSPAATVPSARWRAAPACSSTSSSAATTPLYALSQGQWDESPKAPGVPRHRPARASRQERPDSPRRDGAGNELVLDRPTSIEFVGTPPTSSSSPATSSRSTWNATSCRDLHRTSSPTRGDRGLRSRRHHGDRELRA